MAEFARPWTMKSNAQRDSPSDCTIFTAVTLSWMFLSSIIRMALSLFFFWYTYHLSGTLESTISNWIVIMKMLNEYWKMLYKLCHDFLFPCIFVILVSLRALRKFRVYAAVFPVVKQPCSSCHMLYQNPCQSLLTQRLHEGAVRTLSNHLQWLDHALPMLLWWNAVASVVNSVLHVLKYPPRSNFE